ncbi:hypothetical protein PRIPAC_84171 [Pristionchus pacificus]|uniref:Uncharacterized protein n=1 Tax=Pristionchus pacificus TaxID=54126 RepID=A0A2A6BMQ8_PRIPA|nr:hypothetical protein PRIPAC_84171 [Pristionchus pacificus]|eukprot:PDM67179.1 hypothetical protein PRIPAC_48596 [Pristionchus pacificus]
MLPRPMLLFHITTRPIHLTGMRMGGHHIEHWWGPEKSAGREVVGYGQSGDANYVDRLDYWYPAIRFRKEDEVIAPLRQKEKGDWRNMTAEEKKLLYRYSYRQTLAEFEAPNGYWKVLVSVTATVLSLATFYGVFLTLFGWLDCGR